MSWYWYGNITVLDGETAEYDGFFCLSCQDRVTASSYRGTFWYCMVLNRGTER